MKYGDFIFLSHEDFTPKMLKITIDICNTPTFLYFYLYMNTAYGGHYVYFTIYTSYD